jgi:hypothetical protein
MERPYDWIFHDPDFLPLKNSPRDKYPDFKKFLRDQKRNDYPNRPRAATTKGRPAPAIPLTPATPLTPPPRSADPAS